jgi:hypothetical protein
MAPAIIVSRAISESAGQWRCTAEALHHGDPDAASLVQQLAAQRLGEALDRPWPARLCCSPGEDDVV